MRTAVKVMSIIGIVFGSFGILNLSTDLSSNGPGLLVGFFWLAQGIVTLAYLGQQKKCCISVDPEIQ